MNRVTKKVRRTLGILAMTSTLAWADSSYINAQVLVNESFTGGSAPAGWVATDVSSSGTNWEFDNPGGRNISGGTPGFSGGFAVFDSDFFCNGGEDGTLESPAFDASVAGNYQLEFDNSYRTYVGAGQEGYVEVWNGTAWIEVAAFTPGTNDGYPNPASHKMINITAATGNAAAAKIRFNSINGFCDWWWAVDNVKVTRLSCTPPTATFSIVPDCNNSQFSVSVNVTALGDATSINIREGATVFATTTTAGIFSAGPFASGSSHNITLEHNTNATCNLVSGIQAYNCPPQNDNCSGAVDLTIAASNAACNWVSASTSGATQSSPNPASSCWTSSNDDDIWYTFTPTTSSVVLAYSNFTPTVSASTNNVGMLLFTGSCGTLTTVAGTCGSFGTGGTGGSGEILLDGLTPGTQYYLYLLTNGTDTRATFDVCLHLPPDLPTGCVTNTFPAAGATAVPLNPGTEFTWNASTDPNVTSYNFYLGTTSGSESNIGTSNTNSFIVYGFDPSTTYYWYVAPSNVIGESTGCESNATSFTTAATIPNDECSGAIDISNQNISFGTNVAATQSIPGGACAEGPDANDAWYKLTAGASGTITLEQEVPNFADLVLEVLSGDCANPVEMDCMAESWDIGVNSFSFTATAGTTYYIRTYGWSGTDVGAFLLRATGAPLPVKMSNLAGSLIENNRSQLTWRTFSEHNNAGFEIQRADDGKHFSKIDFISSTARDGNSNQELSYSYIDQKPLIRAAFYRLMQVDQDGKTTYSNIVSLTGKNDGAFTVAAWPNPVTNSLVVSIFGKQGANGAIYVTDMTGKIVWKQAVTGNEATVDMKGLVQGLYLVKYADTEHTQTIKVSKQ